MSNTSIENKTEPINNVDAQEGLTQPKADLPEAKAEGQPEGNAGVQPQANAEEQPDAKVVSGPKNDENSQKTDEVPKMAETADTAKNASTGKDSSTAKDASIAKDASTGKGPKPVGPDKQTWDNPKASDEVKKKIEDQQSKHNQLQENPNAQDPALEALNKKQDIESRNEDPDQKNKLENQTQDNFDPAKNKTEAPAH